MNSTLRVVVVLLHLAIAAVFASAETAADRCLSPYFAVRAGAERTGAFPLQSTKVTAELAGCFAEVRVVQCYTNQGNTAIEATYVFPASTRAAVHGLTMTLGGRRVVAKVKERGEARRTYEQAKAEGKTASLLEEHRPNVFQMNLANIMPGDVVEVELSYSEFLVPTDGIYEWVYPTVVGPRYSHRGEATAAPDEKWVANPYLPEGSQPESDFTIQTRVAGGVPLHGLVSPSHRVAVDFSGPNEARVRLADDESLPANRDFVIRYRLADGAIETGLLLDPPSQPGGDGRFMLLLEPPARPASSMVPPRDFLYVVDVSGSMHGFPLETTVALVREMAAQLRPVDSFNLLLFSGRSQLLSPRSLPATPENVAAAVSILEGKRGGGGTELHAAMELALSLPIEDGKARIISVITDGYLDMEPELFELVRRNLGRSSLFAFGIGSAVNRHLMEGLARAGRGEPIIVSNPDAAQAAATAFRQMIESPVLTGVQLSFDGFVADQLAPWPVPDVFARRPVVVVGRWKGEAAGRIRISGRSGDRDWQAELDVARAGSLETGGIVGRFWARQRIAELSDMQELRLDESRKAEVIGLGLEYNLLTKYTSFVAVDEVVRRMSGDPIQKVAQPSLLPQGVSNLAVGGDVPTTPEPATVLLLGTAAAMLAAVGWRRWRQQLQNAAAGNQEGGGGAGRSGRAEYAPAHHGDAFVDGDKP